MLDRFDKMVIRQLRDLSNPYDGLMDKNFLDFYEKLLRPSALASCRDEILATISQELRKVHQNPVVVLIDEYDSPMHSAIEYGYATLVRYFNLLYPSLLILFQASEFFGVVLGSLLKVCWSQYLRHCRATSFYRIMTRCVQV